MKTAALLTVSSLMGASAFMAPAPKFGRTRKYYNEPLGCVPLSLVAPDLNKPFTHKPHTHFLPTVGGVARMSFENEAGVTAPLGYWDPLGFSADG